MKTKVFVFNDQKLFFVQIKKIHLNKFTDLFNEARLRKLNYSFFHKKYDTAWTGLQNIAIITLDENEKVLAHLGVLPSPMIIGGKKYMSGQISDAVLDPILRGKKVFDLIIKELETLSKENGIDFLWVSPSPQAIRGFETNKWQENNIIKIYSVNLRTLPLNKFSNKFGLSKIYRSYIKLILFLWVKREKSSVNSSITKESGGVEISEKYVAHKNYTHNYLVNLKGFKFWFKIEDGMEIGAMEIFPLEKKHDFEKAVVSLAKILGCHQIKFSTTNGTFQDQIFKNYSLFLGNKIFLKKLNKTIDLSKVLFNGSDFNTF
jgi:hypothetical protein